MLIGIDASRDRGPPHRHRDLFAAPDPRTARAPLAAPFPAVQQRGTTGRDFLGWIAAGERRALPDPISARPLDAPAPERRDAAASSRCSVCPGPRSTLAPSAAQRRHRSRPGLLYYPEAHRPADRRYLAWSTAWNGRRSALVLADSQATRDDLVRAYHVDPDTGSASSTWGWTARDLTPGRPLAGG